MAIYSPLYVKGMEVGLVQSRQDFILPDDAYPVLSNAYVWRERIKRKRGYRLLGRLRRILTALSEDATDGSSTYTTDLLSVYRSTEPNAQIEPGTISLYIDKGGGDETLYQDSASDGTLTYISGTYTISSGSINYSTGVVTLSFTVSPPGSTAVEVNLDYYPSLPVMGLQTRELSSLNDEDTVAFDTKYAYSYSSGWQEFISGTTWSGSDSDFFWTTNYWVDKDNIKVFWETNFSGAAGDPIRYTNGTAWINFAPTIDASANKLTQCLCMTPFRGRMVVFNTLEGANLAGSISYPQRIRWSAIGTPFSDTSSIVTTVNANAWRDDIRGQGGYLDIPTSEDIISIGFVRDYLIVYCERSTWQLMYTSRTIAPFQIQKINSELGAESTFSTIQFDQELLGIGQRGIISCNSAIARRIDIKIPDLVFTINNQDNGIKRVHGIRDFQERIAFWTYSDNSTQSVYPNLRLIYNYENESWATFTDSLTCLGTFQSDGSLTWNDFPVDDETATWENQTITWNYNTPLTPQIIGGNQQGYVEYLDSQVSNDVSLFIQNITGHTTTPTVITSPDHNLLDGQVLQIGNIPTGTPFASSLNDGIFGISVIDANNFYIFTYNSETGQFDLPQLDAPASYVGYGDIYLRDNFSVVSKKFNYLEEGQNIQLGYVDILLSSTDGGEITLNVYLDYNETSPINQSPQNISIVDGLPDSFFNTIVPTTQNGGIAGTKYWQRIYCAARGNFITLEWTFSNAQLNSSAYSNEVEIDSQIIWKRKAGRQLPY